MEIVVTILAGTAANYTDFNIDTNATYVAQTDIAVQLVGTVGAIIAADIIT